MQSTTSIVVNDWNGNKIDFSTPSSRRHYRLMVESTWEIPDHLGAGYFMKTDLGNGLWIGLGEIRLKNRTWEEVYDAVPGVTLISCLKGIFKNQNSCFKNEFELSAGTVALCFSPDPVVIRQIRSGEKCQKVIIKIPLCQIEYLFGNRPLERAIRNQRFFLENRPLSDGMRATLLQLFCCSFQGNARRLYLEGKTLELIAQWLCGDTKEAPLPQLTPYESERIWFARDMLSRDLRNPPSLMSLSKAAGITHTRLNYGFKTIFGHTVFEWLRIQRLEKARMLVMEGRKNMTEIAYEIGYASSSHFTYAFRMVFGTTPSRYR